ncbi:alpha/beta fold hydrolase [Caenispirillum salinarum]|uniref:alpha/beta fold hydrolase n=1 Tax=Caenispirillum salinarum TaxID=859058 RepID=UPI00384C4C22
MEPTVIERMQVSVSGTGSHTVVLANGFGTTKAVWRRILPWLEQRFRVVRFDWPIEPEHYDHLRYSRLDGYADDLMQVIGAVDAAPCTLIAHSMSGMIGMLAGKLIPHSFDRIIMINPSPRYIDDGRYTGGFSEDEVAGLIKGLDDNYMQWVENFAPVVVGAEPGHPDVAEFARGLVAMRPDVALSMAITIFRSDYRDRLAGFGVPTTIVQSTNDPAVPVKVGEYLHSQWPDSRLVVMDMEGHLPHLTQADRFVQVLEQAL